MCHGCLMKCAQGLIVPHISTRQEAEAVAQATRYYPMGDRSSATGGRTSLLSEQGRTQTKESNIVLSQSNNPKRD